MAARLFLFWWEAETGHIFQSDLEKAGWQVEMESKDGSAGYKRVREDPPWAVLFAMHHKPSHSVETAKALRQSKNTCDLPMIFLTDDPIQVANVKSMLGENLYFVHPTEAHKRLTEIFGEGAPDPKTACDR
jgi:DNA-binding response OmpR family regulator